MCVYACSSNEILCSSPILSSGHKTNCTDSLAAERVLAGHKTNCTDSLAAERVLAMQNHCTGGFLWSRPPNLAKKSGHMELQKI